ncbi:MAG: CotH kinase family protein [Phaeodactylibacter sp.]|nr:CotH kinase family protein [Phaeodactylibacter sp.]
MRHLALTFYLVLLVVAILPAQDLYQWDRIPEIRITFAEDNWSDILDKLKRDGDKDRLLATVEIDGKVYEKVGVRYKGNSSYFNVKKSEATKLPFNLEANSENKEQRFEGDVETLKLSNVFRDPSFLREVLSYEIAGLYMPAPRANFARVYVNGTYLGLYNNTESIDDNFLKKYFGEDDGVFFKCDPEWGFESKNPECPEGDKSSLMYVGEDSACYKGFYEKKSDDGWEQLIDLAQILNENPDSIEKILDVNLTLWMLAFNNVLVNLDSYTGRLCHNYYAYQVSNGQFVPLVWDMNLSLGGFPFLGYGKALSPTEMQEMSPLVHYKQKNPRRPLIVNLLRNELYRKIYVGHMMTIVDEQFRSGRFKERAKAWQDLIRDEVAADGNKLYDMDGFEKNFQSTAMAGRTEIIGLNELMGNRIAYLLGHPLFQEAPEIDTVEHLQFDNTLAIQATIQGAEKAHVAYRYNSKDAFQFLEMFDDGGHNDFVGDDNVWGATIDFKPGTQYYIIAESARNAQMKPRRAGLEYFEVE